ncbi:flavin reductase family protein, partial [Streptomyces albipurpureus]|uniref:flavin reductase family protein n=1 Tax=Streptomyces albipurpureus TaxID=2897419 RepID=UPI003CE45303
MDYAGIRLLTEHQQGLPANFARREMDRCAPPTRCRIGPVGVPVLADVPARLVCGVLSRTPAGDHHLVIAEALVGDRTGPGRPLVHARAVPGRSGTERRGGSNATGSGPCSAASGVGGHGWRRWQGHSSQHCWAGRLENVLASNILFVARPARPGTPFSGPYAAPRGRALPASVGTRRDDRFVGGFVVGLRIVVCVKFVPDASG